MERRKELGGEGHRYFDALRRGETITRYTSEANRGWHEILNTDRQSYNTWTYTKQLPLIPINEINGNSEIQQNPLYQVRYNTGINLKTHHYLTLAHRQRLWSKLVRFSLCVG